MVDPLASHKVGKTPPTVVEAGTPPAEICRKLATHLVALWDP